MMMSIIINIVIVIIIIIIVIIITSTTTSPTTITATTTSTISKVGITIKGHLCRSDMLSQKCRFRDLELAFWT